MATPYGFDSVSSTIKQSERHARAACLSPSKGKPNMREFVITDASHAPVWTPRCLRSILSFPPAGCTKYLRENKIKVDGKLPLSARLPRGSTVRVFCRICFWILRLGGSHFNLTDHCRHPHQPRSPVPVSTKANMRRNAGLRASAIGSIPARPVLCSLPRRSRLKRFCCTFVKSV